MPESPIAVVTGGNKGIGLEFAASSPPAAPALS